MKRKREYRLPRTERKEQEQMVSAVRALAVVSVAANAAAENTAEGVSMVAEELTKLSNWKRMCEVWGPDRMQQPPGGEDDEYTSDYDLFSSSDDGGGAPVPQPPKPLPKNSELQGPPAPKFPPKAKAKEDELGLTPKGKPPVPPSTLLLQDLKTRYIKRADRYDPKKAIAGEENDSKEKKGKKESRDCREKKKGATRPPLVRRKVSP